MPLDEAQLTTPDPIKAYLAHWFQLGKKLYIKSGQAQLCPSPVLIPGGYSQEFEACWAYINSGQAGDCYLEGTQETIAQLQQQQWEIIRCARCAMPVALPQNGLPPSSCPCAGLENWPNLELPSPHSPTNNQTELRNLQLRLEDAAPPDHSRITPEKLASPEK